MIILICGFTASGKSILAVNLSKKLNYKFVHTSHILKLIHTKKDLDPNNTKMNNGWYDFSGLDDVREKDFKLDFKLDKYLVDLVKKEDNLVLDSWTLPYLVNNKKKYIKIWLKAPVKTRTLRLMKRDKISLDLSKKILKEKDNFNKVHFKKLYDFNIGKDLSVFDFIVDSSKYDISELCDVVFNLIKKKL